MRFSLGSIALKTKKWKQSKLYLQERSLPQLLQLIIVNNTMALISETATSIHHEIY